MENNEMSFEALYSEALGISSNNTHYFTRSKEGFDGFEDALEIEIAKGFESLNFIDVYSAMKQKNAAEMIRMCKKLSVNYGLKSGVNEKAAVSIESLCRIRSMEADGEAAEASGTTEEPKATDGDKPNEDGKKKEGFFKKILATLKNIFKAIGDFFIQIWEKIKQFFILKVGKIDGDLTADQIKALVSNEKVWKGVPKYAITGGSINASEFEKRVKSIQDDVKEYMKLAAVKNAKDAGKFEELKNKVDALVTKANDNEWKVDRTENVENDKQKVAEWAAKASNLKSAIEAIKRTEQVVKALNAMCKQLDQLCDKLEKKGGDVSKESLAAMRAISKGLNGTRNSFTDIVKAVIFAKKLYNVGKHAKDKKAEETPAADTTTTENNETQSA